MNIEIQKASRRKRLHSNSESVAITCFEVFYEIGDEAGVTAESGRRTPSPKPGPQEPPQDNDSAEATDQGLQDQAAAAGIKVRDDEVHGCSFR